MKTNAKLILWDLETQIICFEYIEENSRQICWEYVGRVVDTFRESFSLI